MAKSGLTDLIPGRQCSIANQHCPYSLLPTKWSTALGQPWAWVWGQYIAKIKVRHANREKHQVVCNTAPALQPRQMRDKCSKEKDKNTEVIIKKPVQHPAQCATYGTEMSEKSQVHGSHRHPVENAAFKVHTVRDRRVGAAVRAGARWHAVVHSSSRQTDGANGGSPEQKLKMTLDNYEPNPLGPGLKTSHGLPSVHSCDLMLFFLCYCCVINHSTPVQNTSHGQSSGGILGHCGGNAPFGNTNLQSRSL